MNHAHLKYLLGLLAGLWMGTGTAPAQQWCSPGATWYHEETEYAMLGYDSYVETRYTGDVLFADSLCQRLSYTVFTYHEPSQMTYTPEWGDFHTITTAGVVYLWEQTRFDTLYYFAAGPGIHWGLPSPSDMAGELRVTVLDTGRAFIDGHDLIYQVVQVTDEDGGVYFPADTIFDRFGPLHMYSIMGYSQGLLIDGGFHSLRCYSDDEMSYTRVEGRCDIGLGIAAPPQQRTVTLYPDPAFDRLWLVGLHADVPLRMAVYDMQGGMVLWETILPQAGLNVSQLAPGLYFIVIPTQDGNELRLKWIKG